ncbi:hypothetical protein AX769_10295 [Frondihabitans sp. PAMC 28766]|uniref:ribbon-helix-helix domain-containing protein n=1 Tax=Frondihabitans sp. PAMC 28766 TaxID=1795630 RepID=UPI00078E7B43|nr:ribbon-helix-helix domain-containing protein [Frondihabitans sp. PAMC 28766]AMM20465.1 hypothetical protein AX769_10295 [Frondihabitans sp. PAMC 28766]
MTKSTNEQLADPNLPLTPWPERPAPITGDEAREIGRMLLDDDVPAGDVLERARRGRASLGSSGSESPTLRFRVPAEQAAELESVAAVTHLQKSELLREGLRLVLARYREDVAPPVPAKGRRRRGVVTLEVTDAELAVLRALSERGIPVGRA